MPRCDRRRDVEIHKHEPWRSHASNSTAAPEDDDSRVVATKEMSQLAQKRERIGGSDSASTRRGQPALDELDPVGRDSRRRRFVFV